MPLHPVAHQLQRREEVSLVLLPKTLMVSAMATVIHPQVSQLLVALVAMRLGLLPLRALAKSNSVRYSRVEVLALHCRRVNGLELLSQETR